jgi:hypothetical protein
MTNITGDRKKSTYDPKLAERVNKEFEKKSAAQEENKNIEAKIEQVYLYSNEKPDENIVYTGYDNGIIVQDKENKKFIAYKDDNTQVVLCSRISDFIDQCAAYYGGISIHLGNRLIFAGDNGKKKIVPVSKTSIFNPSKRIYHLYKNGAMMITSDELTAIKPDGSKTKIKFSIPDLEEIVKENLQDRGLLLLWNKSNYRSFNDDGTIETFSPPQWPGQNPKMKYYKNGIIVKDNECVYCLNRNGDSKLLHQQDTKQFNFDVYENGCLVQEKDKLISVDENRNKTEICTLDKEETFVGYKNGAIVINTSPRVVMYTAYKIK